MSPADGALLLLAAGGCATAFELMRPGRFLPGILGVGGTTAGLFLLCARSPQPLALASGIGFAIVLLLFEFWCPVRFASGLIGTLILAASLCLWSGANPWLALTVALAGCAGGASMLQRAKRARTHKNIASDAVQTPMSSFHSAG